MKYLKLFESFKDIDSICKKFGIYNYTINEDGTIDVDGNVSFCNRELTSLPLKFRNVTGNFDCDYNNLSSLEGCPQSVGGDFTCSYNYLTTLEGSPKEVSGSFFCVSNKIKTFDGVGKIGRFFFCKKNLIWNVWNIINPINDKCYEIIDTLLDYDPIREDGIILDRFNELLKNIDRDPVTEVEGYEIID
jgi:hypothetical protein